MHPEPTRERVPQVFPTEPGDAGCLQRRAKDEPVEGVAVERPGACGVREHPAARESRRKRAQDLQHLFVDGDPHGDGPCLQTVMAPADWPPVLVAIMTRYGRTAGW
jgi:hypothetical protein